VLVALRALSIIDITSARAAYKGVLRDRGGCIDSATCAWFNVHVLTVVQPRRTNIYMSAALCCMASYSTTACGGSQNEYFRIYSIPPPKMRSSPVTISNKL
jgi:hypothetical protein